MTPHSNCKVIHLLVCELTWNFLQTISTEIKQGLLPAKQNECRFYFIIKHTMTDSVYKFPCDICSSVTTWDANAAVFFKIMLMILTLSFAVHIEPMISLEKSTVQHC